jgi:ABC-type uncharacterized transport system ATPase subunit
MTGDGQATSGVRAEPRLELRGISKAYGSLLANDGIDLLVMPGECHAVIGENGAGKSTLMKVIYGMVRPDAGYMLWEGREAVVRNPSDAQALGIGMVFQHFALFDTLTAAENILLATPGRTSLETLSARIETISRRYGLDVEPGRLIHTMSVGERQRVEIVRALLGEPRLLIMDEPTSVLTPQAVESLFATLRRLAAEGCSILYISHKLEEVRDLCERATVLRGGRVAGVCDPREESAAGLARLMIGTDLPGITRREPTAPREPRLVVRGLGARAADPFGTSLAQVDLDVRTGEILGIAGVSGNGQRELVALLSGERTDGVTGTIRIGERDVTALGPRARRALGLAYVPEDRLGQGAVPSLSLAENALLTAGDGAMVGGGLVRRGAVLAYAERCIAAFGVRCGGPEAAASSLSGGNLQKFIIGREVLRGPEVLVVAQPTWGVDVGAAAAIRQALADLRAGGAAILVISEELDELLEISDRIAVLSEGRLTPARAAGEVDRGTIGLAMAGRFDVWMDARAPAAASPAGEEARHAAPA